MSVSGRITGKLEEADIFRIADENEAAGAADAAALVVPSISADVGCGSQGGICDPSTQVHAGGTPAP